MAVMMCMICNEKPATVFLTDIVKNKKQEFHLCPECAKKQGVLIKDQIPLLALIKKFGQAAAKAEEDAPDIQCPHCSMTFKQFRKRGRLGCPEDYEAFGEELETLIEHIHGAARHTGKAPGSPDVTSRQKEIMERARKLDSIRQDLQHAVSAEDYERAAELRDKIRAIEEDRDDT